MRRGISTFAILWLIGAGLLILATGAALAWQEITRTDSCTGIECGLRQLFLIVDLIGIAFGAGYAAAGVGLWRGRPRAQDLGCVLAFAGLLLTPIFLTLFVVMLGVTWFGDWIRPTGRMPCCWCQSSPTAWRSWGCGSGNRPGPDPGVAAGARQAPILTPLQRGHDPGTGW